MPDWPDWCYAPLAVAYAIVADQHGSDAVPREAVPDIGRVGALMAWRATKRVIRVEDNLAAALASSPIHGDLPSDVLLHWPKWCHYVTVGGLDEPGATKKLGSFFAHLEADANTGRPELRFLVHTTDGLWPLPLHLGPWPLRTALDRAIAEAVDQASALGVPADPASDVDQADALAAQLTRLVSAVLYLSSSSPDMADAADPARAMRPPKAMKVRGKWVLKPASRVTTWLAGSRLSLPAGTTGSWEGSQDDNGAWHYTWLTTEGIQA